MGVRSLVRHNLRRLGQAFPGLQHHSGKLGLGRWATSGSPVERVVVDGDVAIELDLSVPSMRPLYFLYDISSMLETVLIRRLLLPGDVFVDVGANIGYFSLIAAKYAGKVVAFEPSPMTRPYLRRNLELNPALASRVTVHSLALSDHCGSAEMFNPPDHPGMAALRPTGQEREVVESVALDTMDHALVDQHVSFIKVDVEGGELDVLNGACLTIDRWRPLVLVELIERYQARFGHTCQDLVGFLRQRDYEGYRVQEDPVRRGQVLVAPLDLADLSETEVNNGLFIPTGRVADVLERLRK